MNRLFVMIIACIVALTSFGPHTGMALEQGSMNEIAQEVIVEAQNANLLDGHSQMDCCKRPAHTPGDHQGHCGTACAILENSSLTAHHLSKIALLPAEPVGLAGLDQGLPKRPPRTLL